MGETLLYWCPAKGVLKGIPCAEVNGLLRKWALWFAATAVVVAGCGGSDNGGSSGGGSGGGGVFTRGPVPNFPAGERDYGQVFVYILTGQGRAPGNLYAVFSDLDITDDFGSVRYLSGQPIGVNLSQYTPDNNLRLLVPFTSTTATANSRFFQEFPLRPQRFVVEGSGGTPDFGPGNGAAITSFPSPLGTYPSRIRAFPGRDTFIPLFLDDAVFTVSGSSIAFDDAQFRTLNLPSTDDPATSDRIVGTLSDFVRFDISALAAADRPNLAGISNPAVAGAPATHVFFSGDSYAIGSGGATGAFEVLTLDPTSPLEGTFRTAPSTGFSGTAFPNTYSLRQPNPTDLDPDPTTVSRITSLYGRFRTEAQVFTSGSLSTFDVILFPNSQESYNATRPGDLVAIQRNASGTIVNFYFGEANLTDGRFVLYPIRNIVSASPDDGITGSFSGLLNRNGLATLDEPSVRSGTWTFDAGQSTIPGSFPNTGVFSVFRR